MDDQSKIKDEKVFAILLNEIVLLKSEVELSKTILENYIQNTYPDNYNVILESFEKERLKYRAYFSQYLHDLLLVESDDMTNLLLKLLSK
jgi:hypothetical protein